MQWEEDSWFYRWERMLGLVWTPEDLQVLAEQDAKNKGNKTIEELAASAPDAAPSVLRYPLSLLIRPELLKSLQERAIPAQGGLFGMPHVPSDALSLSKASKDDFLRRMGVQSATDEFDKTDIDPYSPSQRPRGGFAEGKPRTIGGGGRRK